MNDDRTSAAASFGHDVEERSCVTRQGQRVEFLLGSTCLGLCDVDFPDHRTKLHDVTMMMSSDDGGFHLSQFCLVFSTDTHSAQDQSMSVIPCKLSCLQSFESAQ